MHTGRSTLFKIENSTYVAYLEGLIFRGVSFDKVLSINTLIFLEKCCNGTEGGDLRGIGLDNTKDSAINKK